MTIDLLPYQQRVVDERDALSEKVDRLRSFCASAITALPLDEQNDLHEQLVLMGSYLAVLNRRITKFQNESKSPKHLNGGEA